MTSSWDQNDVELYCGPEITYFAEKEGFGVQVSSKYGTWYCQRSTLQFMCVCLGLALHIIVFATQYWQVPRTKQLSTVAILLYRFLFVWCLEHLLRSVSLAVYCLSLHFLADEIFCRSYVGSVYRVPCSFSFIKIDPSVKLPPHRLIMEVACS